MLEMTKDRMMVLKVCQAAGGFKAMGRKLGIAYQNFQAWKRVPADRLVQIEKITGIPRHEIRPDLFKGYEKQ